MLKTPLKLNLQGFSVSGHILDANGQPVGHPEMVHEYNMLAARVSELEKELEHIKNREVSLEQALVTVAKERDAFLDLWKVASFDQEIEEEPTE